MMSSNDDMGPLSRPVWSARDLGLLIKARRRELGLDQDALAKKIGVSRQWLIQIEHGKDRAAVGLVLRALDALGLRVTVGSGDRPEENPPFAVGTADVDAICDRIVSQRRG